MVGCLENLQKIENKDNGQIAAAAQLLEHAVRWNSSKLIIQIVRHFPINSPGALLSLVRSKAALP